MFEYETKSVDQFESELRTKSFQSSIFADSSGWSDLGAIVNPRLLKSIYQTEDWVFILVDRIASKLAQIPWQVHKETILDGEMVLEPALSHPVQKMLDDPNPLQSSYSFKYAAITDHSVTGNAIIFASPANRWLVQVPAELVDLQIDGNGNLSGYRLTGFDPQAFPSGSKLMMAARDVIHVKRPNPSSVYWGLSPIIPGHNPTLFNKFSNEYLLNFYKRGAQPGLVAEMTEETNVENAKKILTTLESMYTGRTNQRRTMVLPKGVKLTASNTAHTLADQQLIEYLRNNRETLINIFGVPKHELSIAEAGSLGSEEYKVALKNFWQGPLMSIGAMFESALTSRLSYLLGEGFVIRLNYTAVPILQEDVKERADTANSMLATMTYNEVRQKIWKLPPIEGGDILRDLRPPAAPQFPGFAGSFGQPPQLSLPAKPAVEIQTPEKQDVRDYELLAAETKREEPDIRQQNAEALGAWLKADDSKWIREARQRIDEETAKASQKLEKRWLKLLEDQVVAAVKVLKKHFGEKATIPDKRKLRRAIDEAMDQVEDEWKSGYETDLSAQIELGYDSVLDVPFNEPYKDGIDAIRARNKDKRRETLRERGIQSFDQISKTTTEKIMKSIEQGLEDNLSILDIAKNITEIGANAAGRAFTIARTESMIANSIGQAAATEDAAEVIPDLVKVWLNMGDEHVRGNPGGLYPDSEADHWDMQGETVAASENFSNGLSYPRDTKGPAGEVINCRCTLLTVSEQDLPKLGLKR